MDESNPSNIRQMSAILIKNSLLHVEAFTKQWVSQIPPEQKKEIRDLVLAALASSKSNVRTSASSVISSICKIDPPVMKTWPDLLPSLIKNLKNENINLRLAAIEALGFVCEEASTKNFDVQTVDNIMTALISNLVEVNEKEENAEKIIIQLLKAMYFTIKLAEKNFRETKDRGIIMGAIFSIVEKYQNSEEVLDKVASLFIEMLSNSNYYDYLEDSFPKIVEFSFKLVQLKKDTDERLALLCLEIICCIGDEEVSRQSPSDISIAISSGGGYVFDKEGKKISKEYLSKIWQEPQLQQLILNNVKVPEDDEDENEWNISKACLTILGLTAQVVDYQQMKNFYVQLNELIKQSINNPEQKAKC